MSKKITIKINDNCTNLKVPESLTFLDVYLSIATLFDLLDPDSKQLLIKKLEKIASFEAGELLS